MSGKKDYESFGCYINIPISYFEHCDTISTFETDPAFNFEMSDKFRSMDGEGTTQSQCE